MGAAAFCAALLVVAIVPQASAASVEEAAVVATASPSPSPSPTENGSDSALLSTRDLDTMPAVPPEEPAPTVPAPEVNPAPADPAPTAPAPAPAPKAAPKAAPDATPARDENLVAPLLVPPASTNTAVITVKVGGDRAASNAVSGYQGVTLRLYQDNNGTRGAALSDSWATCVSDAAGDCSFVVPDTNLSSSSNCNRSSQTPANRAGVNCDRRFWIVAESAGSTGLYLNQALNIAGGYSSPNPIATVNYTFRTGTELRATRTYKSGTHFMTPASNTMGSSGIWQVSRNNPQLQPRCTEGLNVALVLDLSTSVGNSLSTLKTAAKGFVGALDGTGSKLSLFTFSSNAPSSSGTSGRNYDDLISIQGNRSLIDNRINAYGLGQATNWDRGIVQVARSSNPFDLAIVITDGMPTISSTASSISGYDTALNHVEDSIFSANALKAKGTRVLAVGVGSGVSAGGNNLSAISGPTAAGQGIPSATADYFQSGWNELSALLSEVAAGATCQATIDVEKQTKTYGSSSFVNGGSGWTFQATTTAGTLTPSSQQTTSNAGTASWTVKYGSAQGSSSVSLSEILGTHENDGWSLDSISCTVNNAPLTVSGETATVNLSAGDALKCTFKNAQLRVPGIEITKTAWNGDAQLPNGSDVVAGSTVTWKYLVKNTGQTTLQGIVVTDDQVGAVNCPSTQLAIGAQMTCTASGPVTALN